MSHVLFKQSFKPRAAPGTPGANVAHLSYIATRPGAVYNPECGFGLWGQLPGNGAMRYQDLETAKEIVREASEEHTLYRAIVSVGQADAEAKGLYDIGRWQDLIADHMADVAKAMDIAPEKLAWCASFHHAKGHPHCHILYWDTGTDPRPEALPRKEWTAKAERIRAAFSESLFREEIRQAQKAEREEDKALRATLQALCLESCPAEGEDLAQVLRSPRLESVERAMQELIDGLPRKGSLRYAYLPPDYKAKVDALVEEVLKFPALQKNLESCLACTRQVAEGYSRAIYPVVALKLGTGIGRRRGVGTIGPVTGNLAVPHSCLTLAVIRFTSDREVIDFFFKVACCTAVIYPVGRSYQSTGALLIDKNLYTNPSGSNLL